jgi:hypothetical protein
MSARVGLDLDRIRQALAEAVELVTEVPARWANQNAPRTNATTFVELGWTMPPAPMQVDHDAFRTLPARVRVTVAASFEAGRQGIVFVDGAKYSALALVADDPTGLRDLLLATLHAGLDHDRHTATAVGGNAIDVARIEVGGLTAVKVAPPDVLTSGVLELDEVFETGGARLAALSVNVHGSAVGREAVDTIADAIATGLRAEDVRMILRRAGIGVAAIGRPRDLSGLEGAELEARVQFDVRLNLRTSARRPATTIDTVQIGRTVAGRSRTLTIPEP